MQLGKQIGIFVLGVACAVTLTAFAGPTKEPQGAKGIYEVVQVRTVQGENFSMIVNTVDGRSWWANNPDPSNPNRRHQWRAGEYFNGAARAPD